MITLASFRSVAIQGSSITLFGGLLLSGCASPGTPRPPSLHLPQPVSNLTAERVGDEVFLRWMTPTKTTDDLNVESPLTAQICRQAGPAVAGKQQSCQPVRRLPTVPGHAEAVDVLPPALTRGPSAVLEYRVELLNRRERSAGLSAPAFAATGAAPPLVMGLQAEATADGALLRWIPEDAADAVELTRRRGDFAALDKPPTKQPGNPKPSVSGPAQVHLLATRAGTGDTPFQRDAGGTLDRTARRGETYIYTAQRVRHLVVNGQALELRSAASAPVSLVMRDTFPPRPPLGVEAVASVSDGNPAIDLSWMPSTEVDLAGYLVYRADVLQPPLGAEGESLTPTLVLQPAFRDTNVRPGHTYQYTVVAVDKTGNRSAPSGPAREELPLP